LIVKPYKYTIKYDTHFCLLEKDPCYEHECKSGGTCVADASDQLKNLTNVVIGKLGKLVHKQNCSHIFFDLINYNIILQLRYITIETKEVAHIEYNMFLFPHSYSTTTKVVSLNPAHGEV
jgi:hypothetical protein